MLPALLFVSVLADGLYASQISLPAGGGGISLSLVCVKTVTAVQGAP